jgi:hypothetical protein
MLNFSFKREPVWMLVFSLGPALLALFIVVALFLLR